LHYTAKSGEQTTSLFPMFLFLFSGQATSRCWPNARTGRGAQCKNWARSSSEQWFYDVILFSQPCYDRGTPQIYSKAL